MSDQLYEGWDRTLRDVDGQPVGGASVDVRVAKDATDVNAGTIENPTLYEDAFGETTKSNPFSTPANGRVRFYLPRGLYHVIIDDGNATREYRNVQIGHGSDALRRVEAVESRSNGGPPSSPSNGDAYIVDNATGDWSAFSQDDLASFDAGQWWALTPDEGFGPVWVKDEDIPVRYNGSWQDSSGGGGFPIDPENATDSGTDSYDSETTTSTPNAGEVILRDFQSPNTTITPTLDGVTIVTRDGSVLWAGVLDRVHRLLYDGTNYRVLDLAIDAQPLEAPLVSTNPSLAFDTWRTPNPDRPTFIVANFQVYTDGTDLGRVIWGVDESGGTSVNFDIRFIAPSDWGQNVQPYGASSSLIVPAGASYIIQNDSDPSGNNNISTIREFTL